MSAPHKITHMADVCGADGYHNTNCLRTELMAITNGTDTMSATLPTAPTS